MAGFGLRENTKSFPSFSAETSTLDHGVTPTFRRFGIRLRMSIRSDSGSQQP